MSPVRPAIRWLLTPLLVVIDKRITWRSQPLDERVSRVERDMDALRGYTQLLAGALAPSPGRAPSTRPAAAAPDVDGSAVANGSGLVAAPVAGEKPVDHLDRFACPVCRSAVKVVPEIVTTEGRVKRGYVPCATCDETIAVIRDFRADFRTRGGPPPASAPPPVVVPPVGEIRVPFDDARLCRSGSWTVWDERFAKSTGSVTDSIEYRGRFTDALVHMVTQPDGGIVDFFVDGKHVGVADLYRDHWFVLPFTIASDLPFEEHVLRLQPRGTGNDAAGAADVLVAELVLTGPRTDPAFEEPGPMNRGNAYMEVFERVIAQVPVGEPVLEVGGGERRRMRPGYINLEYLTMECADVFGDIQRLPFQSDTFSLVLAQAVFEHVNNPFVAAEELARVTRPGGLIVIDAAFMQPLHAAPYHYFNMTPWGVTELFRSCVIVECEHYDGIAFTLDWMLRSVGADSVATKTEFDEIMERVRTIEAKLSHADFRKSASGFYVIARKPGA